MRSQLISLLIFLFYFNGYSQLQINATQYLFDLDELNRELALNQYPVFISEAFSFQALNTGYDNEDAKVGTRNGFLYTLFDTEENANTGTPPNTNRDVEMRSIGFLSGLEFPLVRNKFITLGPSLDFILSQQRLRFISDFPSNPTFGNILSSAPQIETYRNTRLMFDGRVNLLLHFPHKENKPKIGIGVTGGYRLDPWTANWKYERLEKVEIPGTQQNGFHYGVVLTVKFPKISPPPLSNKKKEQRS